MADDNNPQGTVEQEPVADTTDSLLDKFLNPEPSQEDNSEPEDGQEAQDGADSQDEAQSEEDDQAGQEEDDQPRESEFATDDAKVRLEDGTEVTIADLKRGNLFQADYTRKTQEIGAIRKELESRQAEIAQQSQQFESQINLALEIAAANLPPEPTMELFDQDPQLYQRQKILYDKRVGELQQLIGAKQQHEQAQHQQQQQAFQEQVGREHQALMESMPELSDGEKRQAFSSDMMNAIKKYGFSDQDVSQLYDHRFFLAAKDLIAYQKLMAQKPKAMAKAKGKPPLSPGANRQSPQQQNSARRQSDWKRLRETGGKDADAFDRLVDPLV